MIISHSRKFVFVHVNKCGGTSMVKALVPYLDLERDIVLGGEGFEKQSQKYMKEYGIYKHSSAIKIRKFLGEKVWDDYYTFAFVRNPWDKILSTYFWFLKTHWGEKGKGGAIRRLPDFTAYVRSKFLDEKSCSWFVYDKEKCIVDDIFRFEEMQKSFKNVCMNIGIPPANLPFLNATREMRKESYSTYYTAETRSIIEEKYAMDMAHFSYLFDEKTTS